MNMYANDHSLILTSLSDTCNMHPAELVFQSQFYSTLNICIQIIVVHGLSVMAIRIGVKNRK